MKTNWCKIIFLIFILVVSASYSVGLASEKPIVLRLASNTAPVGLKGSGEMMFAEEVKKHTNGKVEIEIYWGESLLKQPEILRGIQDGTVDMGYINPNYYPNQLLINGIFPIFPRGPNTFAGIYEVVTRCLEEIPEMNEELEAANIKPIFINTCLPATIVSTKPFTSFEDFRGKKIRASSRWVLDRLKGAGAIPVSVSWGECYMSLQTGIIDGVYANLDGMRRAKLDEVAPNVFTMRQLWFALMDHYPINLDKFNSLPEEIQKQLVEAGKSASLRFSELYDAEWERVVNEQKNLGYTVTAASDEDIEKWESMPIMEKIKDDWVKAAEEAGLENASEIQKRISKIIAEVIEKEKGEK